MNQNPIANEEFIETVNQIIDNNLDREYFGVSELAKGLGMSRSNLHRKLNSITKISANKYLRQYRLKKGLEMLRQTTLNVSEVAYRVGFSSPSYFVKCFHDFYGYSPGEIRNREKNETASLFTLKNKRNKFFAFAAIVAASLLTGILVFYNPFSSQIAEHKKTIAVLPFKDHSPETGNSYIINGLMDEILNKLQKINEFRVKSRTDSEKYRDTEKSISQIAKELGVNYILEGSGQKIGNEIKLRLQLNEASTGNHLWSKTFTENVNDIFGLQENVALHVASKLNAELTDEEKQEVQKLPTENLTAYNLYLQGLDYSRIADLSGNLSNWTEGNQNRDKAKNSFLKAIQLDSTFAEAYVQLGHYYINKKFHHSNNKQKRICLDSGFYYANKALEFDDKQHQAQGNLLDYYLIQGMDKEADKIMEEWVKGLSDNYTRYENLIPRYAQRQDNYNIIRSYHLYKETKPEDIVTPFWILWRYRDALINTGYFELAKNVNIELLALNSDTLEYISNMVILEMNAGNFEAALEYELKVKEMDEEYYSPLIVMVAYLYLGDFPNAYKYLLECEELEKKLTNKIEPSYLNGLAYLKNGELEKAKNHFRGNIKHYQDIIELDFLNSEKIDSYFLLFSNYLGLSEKEKAFEYLKEINRIKYTPNIYLVALKYWPGFDEIRSDPVFIDVQNTLETQYQKQHKNVGKLLRELGEIE